MEGRHLVSSWFMFVFLTYCSCFLFFASFPISLLKYQKCTPKQSRWLIAPQIRGENGFHFEKWPEISFQEGDMTLFGGYVDDVSGGWRGLVGGWGADWPICEGLKHKLGSHLYKSAQHENKSHHTMWEDCVVSWVCSVNPIDSGLSKHWPEERWG